ncbi:N-acetylmuramoyl-L-alanine amidase [Kitasatospora sp. NPDC056181]|uniref:peptidoglycan recognition protein family protein n=1 Tax=Kitasatospora sp. NPDC056181 TaxID=3345737 RepID=UPI0035D77B03
MSWYPGAERMEVQPESDEQPAIVPTQVIFHSIAAPWTTRRMYEYWQDSTNLESHFGVGYSGAVGQFIGTQTRADANMHANRRPDGTGAVSIETASNDQHTDPWTDAQVQALIELGLWLHQQHGIPIRVCRSADDPGFGYHRLFPDWSDGGTACPGDARVQQFHSVILPGIAARAAGQPAPTTPNLPAPTAPEEDDDMTPEQLLATPVPVAKLSDGYVPTFGEVVNGAKEADAKLDALRADFAQILLSAPMPDYAVLPGGYRPSVGEVLNGSKTADARIAALTAQLAAQSAAITALAQQVAAGGGINADDLVARIEAAIASITIHLTTASKES